jgi:polyphenol oxidase
MKGSARVVRETPVPGSVPRFTHPEWADLFPWLVQGITASGRSGAGSGEADRGASYDLALFGRTPVGDVLTRWAEFGTSTGTGRWIHGRQVHGSTVRVHDAGGPPGLYLAPACDGHVTAAPGALLTVGLADCVGVSLVDPERRVIALLHAGWRGAAAGILRRGIETMAERFLTDPKDLHVHLGPAICAECYEVGPEVHEALGLEVPDGPTPVDLRGALAARAEKLGVAADRITVSAFCTKCGDSPFFSHRAGDAARHQAYLGILEG